MPSISNTKKNKITEQVLHYLFTIAPQSAFTVSIAAETARDEEFTKALLAELKSKKLVIEVKKNAVGTPYKRRQRWRLSNEVYLAYQQRAASSTSPSPRSFSLDEE